MKTAQLFVRQFGCSCIHGLEITVKKWGFRYENIVDGHSNAKLWSPI